MQGSLNMALIRRLFRETGPKHRRDYAISMVAMLIAAGMTSLTALSMASIVDSMATPENRTRVFMVAASVLGIFVVRGLASYVQVVFMARAGNRLVADKQRELFRRLVSQDVGYFNQTESSDLLMRVTQSAQMARTVVDTIVTGAVRDTFTLLGLVAVMVWQQPLLSMVCLIVGPLSILGVRAILARVRGVMAEEMQGIALIIRVVQEAATGARVVKAYQLERNLIGRMDKAIAQVQDRANRMIRLEGVTTPLMDSIAGLAIGGIVALSVLPMFGQQPGTAGQLMSFVTAFLMAYEPAKRLSRIRVTIEAGMFGVGMMYDMIDAPLKLSESPNATPLPEGPGELRFENVHFGYGDASVIDGVTQTFPAHSTTALVGPSGSGKSTLMNLVMRLYDPSEGRILIDGADIREATFDSLRRKMAYVGQDTFLFSDSVLENIRIGRADATDEEVYAAARIAQADDFITAMPKGYATQVGENGAFLSGGQRQRLSIARAVLRRAPILLLDEATSALDSGSEAAVRVALEKISRETTTLVIAHRLSTILNADLICYIEAGKVVEQGTLAELLALNGRFRKLFDSQFSGQSEAAAEGAPKVPLIS